MLSVADTSVVETQDRATAASSQVLERDDSDVLITPQNISVQYYRRETLRVATVLLILACVDIFITPIDALLLLPSSIAVSYWLRDGVRFVHGGDIRRCFNRDCSLMYYHMCCGVALGISLLDCVVLIINANKVPDAAVVNAGGSESPVTSVSPVHSSTWFGFAIGINSVSFFTLLYGLYCIKKLRLLLETGTAGGPVAAESVESV